MQGDRSPSVSSFLSGIHYFGDNSTHHVQSRLMQTLMSTNYRPSQKVSLSQPYSSHKPSERARPASRFTRFGRENPRRDLVRILKAQNGGAMFYNIHHMLFLSRS